MQESDYKSCEVKLVASELNKDVKSPSDVTSIRNKLQEKLRLFAKELDNCADKDSLAHISSKINASYCLYKSLQKHGTLSPITPVTNSPSNKKVDQQNRFRSTKKKRTRTTNVRFAKPTQEDIESLFTDSSNVKEQLDAFGVPEKIIKRALKKNGVINTSEVNLDEDHPPPEALGFALSNIKPYFTGEAWERVIVAMKALKDEWRCNTCNYARVGNMIMCDACCVWHHWQCVKIEDEDEEWFCQECENLNNMKQTT